MAEQNDTTTLRPRVSRPRDVDVARAAGVSPATVSMSLRDDPRVRARTRDKVRRVARKIGLHGAGQRQAGHQPIYMGAVRNGRNAARNASTCIMDRQHDGDNRRKGKKKREKKVRENMM